MKEKYRTKKNKKKTMKNFNITNMYGMPENKNAFLIFFFFIMNYKKMNRKISFFLTSRNVADNDLTFAARIPLTNKLFCYSLFLLIQKLKVLFIFKSKEEKKNREKVFSFLILSFEMVTCK